MHILHPNLMLILLYLLNIYLDLHYIVTSLILAILIHLVHDISLDMVIAYYLGL